MTYEENEVCVIDCEDCPYSNQMLSSAPSLSNLCKNCPLIEKEYDRLRIKTRLFTKEYDKKGNLYSIDPFFIDVRFDPLVQNVMKTQRLIDRYFIKTGAQVSIYEKSDGVGYIYFISVPEMNMNFKEIKEIYKKVEIFKKEGKTDDPLIKRWYLDYGILEHLLFDDKVLEININPPAYKTAIRIIHSDYDECVSNIYPSDEALSYLALRMKISTGRPLNRAQPQLDGEIFIEQQKARVCAIIDPFSIYGKAYSIRKHRENPWTLPLFIKKGSLNNWFAGLMGFAIAQGRSFLVAGPRGSGKTAMLGALLLELLPKYRMITIEDTQELPIDAFKSLGYDILPLKVRSALSDAGMEMPIDKGLRTSLRLGDSCLILGEIRSKEAKLLYEAMRVGAMANVVAGTIHGDSPYGVFDRVVNDLGVPAGSFKVTDLIVIVNQIKLPGGLKRVRRVLKVTEVLKEWKDEPEFQDLLIWNPQTDQLEPTEFLLNGKSILLKQVLEIAKGYKNYNDVLNEIKLRGWAKQVLVESVEKDSFLEAKYVSPTNTLFTKYFEKYLPLESQQNMVNFTEKYKEALEKIIKIHHKRKKTIGSTQRVVKQEDPFDRFKITQKEQNLRKIEVAKIENKKPKNVFSAIQESISNLRKIK
jgi:type IV secretory pathway ATPase VirB11/archaellum biosynthesis ATPase